MDNDSVRESSDFEERTKLLFDESVAALDGRTRSGLTRARYRALEELSAPSTSARLRRWLPAGAVAAVAIVSVILMQGRIEPVTSGSFDVAAVTDLEILLGEEELDMLEELEFYAWLEEQAELTDGQIVEDGVG